MLRHQQVKILISQQPKKKKGQQPEKQQKQTIKLSTSLSSLSSSAFSSSSSMIVKTTSAVPHTVSNVRCGIIVGAVGSNNYNCNNDNSRRLHHQCSYQKFHVLVTLLWMVSSFASVISSSSSTSTSSRSRSSSTITTTSSSPSTSTSTSTAFVVQVPTCTSTPTKTWTTNTFKSNPYTITSTLDGFSRATTNNARITMLLMSSITTASSAGATGASASVGAARVNGRGYNEHLVRISKDNVLNLSLLSSKTLILLLTVPLSKIMEKMKMVLWIMMNTIVGGGRHRRCTISTFTTTSATGAVGATAVATAPAVSTFPVVQNNNNNNSKNNKTIMNLLVVLHQYNTIQRNIYFAKQKGLLSMHTFFQQLREISSLSSSHLSIHTYIVDAVHEYQNKIDEKQTIRTVAILLNKYMDDIVLINYNKINNNNKDNINYYDSSSKMFVPPSSWSSSVLPQQQQQQQQQQQKSFADIPFYNNNTNGNNNNNNNNSNNFNHNDDDDEDKEEKDKKDNDYSKSSSTPTAMYQTQRSDILTRTRAGQNSNSLLVDKKSPTSTTTTTKTRAAVAREIMLLTQEQSIKNIALKKKKRNDKNVQMKEQYDGTDIDEELMERIEQKRLLQQAKKLVVSEKKQKKKTPNTKKKKTTTLNNNSINTKKNTTNKKTIMTETMTSKTSSTDTIATNTKKTSHLQSITDGNGTGFNSRDSSSGSSSYNTNNKNEWNINTMITGSSNKMHNNNNGISEVKNRSTNINTIQPIMTHEANQIAEQKRLSLRTTSTTNTKIPLDEYHDENDDDFELERLAQAARDAVDAVEQRKLHQQQQKEQDEMMIRNNKYTPVSSSAHSPLRKTIHQKVSSTTTTSTNGDSAAQQEPNWSKWTIPQLKMELKSRGYFKASTKATATASIRSTAISKMKKSDLIALLQQKFEQKQVLHSVEDEQKLNLRSVETSKAAAADSALEMPPLQPSSAASSQTHNSRGDGSYSFDGVPIDAEIALAARKVADIYIEKTASSPSSLSYENEEVEADGSHYSFNGDDPAMTSFWQEDLGLSDDLMTKLEKLDIAAREAVEQFQMKQQHPQLGKQTSVGSSSRLHVVPSKPDQVAVEPMTLPTSNRKVQTLMPSTSSDAVPLIDYASMTVPLLKFELKGRQLPTSGRKSELIARLVENDSLQFSLVTTATTSAQVQEGQPKTNDITVDSVNGENRSSGVGTIVDKNGYLLGEDTSDDMEFLDDADLRALEAIDKLLAGVEDIDEPSDEALLEIEKEMNNKHHIDDEEMIDDEVIATNTIIGTSTSSASAFDNRLLEPVFSSFDVNTEQGYEEDPTSQRMDYDKMAVAQIKSELKRRSLRVTGKKTDLVERLRAFDSIRSYVVKPLR